MGRIKGHTAFRGPYEFGLAKMMAIGLGKREGADSLHRFGFGKMGERIPPFARIVFDQCNIIFDVGLIENEMDKTCRIEVIPGEEIFDQEPELLKYAKSRMPRLLLPEMDVLVVREIGKNFTGSGMDPNVTGTFGTPFASGGIRKQRVAVLDISEESHGNYIGLGMADVTTKRTFEKLQTNATYFNMLTSTVLGVGKIPMVVEDDRMALQTAVKTLNGVDRNRARLVYLKNTLSLEKIILSEALLDIVPGVVLAAFSIFYMCQIAGIKVLKGLGSTPLNNHFVPWLWSGALLFLSLWLIVRGVLKYRRFGAKEGGSLWAALTDKREVIASFIALGLYVAFMDTLGFVIATTAYVFVQIFLRHIKEIWVLEST